MARPRKINREKAFAAICEHIAGGGLVKDACKAQGISRGSLHLWCSEDITFLNTYTRAREEQAHAMAEQAVEIAHGDDWLTQARSEAIEGYEEELREQDDKHWFKKVQALKAGVINRDRMRVDALKWMASKIAPRNYGEKITQEHVGADGGPVEIKVRFVRDARVV